MATMKIEIITCDNPDCDTEERYDKDDLPTGYHLSGGIFIMNGGGPIPKVYACSEDCLVPAINAAIDEAWRS